MVHLALPFVALLLLAGSSLPGSWAKQVGGGGGIDDVGLNSIEQQPAKGQGQVKGKGKERLAVGPVQGAPPGGDLPPSGDQLLQETEAPSVLNVSRSVEDEEFLTRGPSTFTVTSSEVLSFKIFKKKINQNFSL
jgi:hypothetical protein